MAPKEIHEDMVLTLSEESLSYAPVNKQAAEFKRGRVSSEDDPSQEGQKLQLLMDKWMSFTVWFWMADG